MASSTASETYSPEYLDAYNAQGTVAANTMMLIITTTLLALRLYARSLTPASRGWDELLLFFSWIFMLGLITVIYGETLSGNL